jgi:hypothetical protein
MSDHSDDQGPRGMGRWAVVIPGSVPPAALAELEREGIKEQLLANWQHGVPRPFTMVAVRASSEDDAKGRVRRALSDHDSINVSDLRATSYRS